jgi:hypothetical protein
LLQEHGFFGAGTAGGRIEDATWNVITSGGFATVGKQNHPYTLVETDLRPFEEEVIVQLDTLDGVMRMWAWRDDEQPNEDIAPLIEEEFDLPAALPYLWGRSDDGPSSALFSWVAISTDHMPVNMSVPLSDLIGDFSGDDILHVADIDLLTAQIVGEPSNHLGSDLSGDGTIDDADLTKWRADAAAHNGFGEPYLVGDSNLDGTVDAADLNNLALNWLKDDVPRWSAGDFNADGSINVLDLNAVALNWGRSIRIAATANAPVPEPSAWFLAVIGWALAWGLRRRGSRGA